MKVHCLPLSLLLLNCLKLIAIAKLFKVNITTVNTIKERLIKIYVEIDLIILLARKYFFLNRR